MGKVTKTSFTKKVSPKLKNKRRKRELDKIHSKILKAKSKLDNIEKHGNKSRRKKQNQAKICSRLLPKPVAGIYRNGAKGKNIQKAETSENKINNARLKADVLQLFNGDTSESIEDDVEITLSDEPTMQSLNKSFVENSLERAACKSEQSPVLGNRHNRNQNVYLVKNKTKNTFSKNLDSNRNRKENVDESKNTVQKEVICKRRSFQNKQLENTSNLQIFDASDITQENTINEEKQDEIIKNKFRNQLNKNKFWDPFNRFEEFCRKMAAGISDGFPQTYRPDPVKTTLKKLRVSYAECFRQQLLRERKTQSINIESPVEYQACTYSNSQVSPVEFEVPKCDDENDTIIANLSESITQKTNKLHRISNFMCEKGNDITQYDSTSRSSQNSFAAYKNDENSGNQFVNQFSDVSQLSKSVNLYFVNETHSVDSQKNSNHVSLASKQNRYEKDNLRVNYKHSRDVDKTGRSATLIFSNESVLSAEKPLANSKLSTVTADTCAQNIFQKCNRTANEHNNKNIKQIPKIIRRYNDIKVTKSTHSTQLKNVCPESLYKTFETTVFNNHPDNNVAKESCVEYPNMFESVPTPSVLNMPLDRSQLVERPNKFSHVSAPKISIMPFGRSKLLEPQIESMKIKDFRESQINNADINVRSKVNKVIGNNRLSRFNNTSQTFEDLYHSNTYVKTPVQEIASNAKQVFSRNNCRPVTYLQTANIPRFNIEQAQVPSQTKVHVYEANNAKQQFIGNTTHDQNSNILFNNVSNKIATLNFPQNIQFDKKCGKSTCEKLFGKPDAECVKNRTNQNVYRYNEWCNCHDSVDCPRKHSVSQTHYFDEDTVQAMTRPPNISYDVNVCSNNTDKSVDSSNVGLQNASFLPMEQKCNPYTYLQTVDGQHHAVLLQDTTQPVKYFAVKNDRGVQRIPVYINNGSVNMTENVLLKLALMNPNSRKIYSREVTNQVIPLQANSMPVDEFALHKTSAQPMNTVLFNSDLQSNTWYASNL